jgi:hypothetical protein
MSESLFCPFSIAYVNEWGNKPEPKPYQRVKITSLLTTEWVQWAFRSFAEMPHDRTDTAFFH